jgi:tRNA G18 (ribose-2'-O)-methylase SpoU
MDFERIESAADPRVADYRGVSEPGLLRSRNLFVAEGRRVVSRVLQNSRWSVRSVLVNQAALRCLQPTLSALAAPPPVLVCEADDFLGIAGYPIHRGCLALVERPAPIPLEEALGGSRLAVVLEGVSNPDNIGGVFRNAAAFGADLVVLSPACATPLYRKAVRTSMGAALDVPFVHLQDWPTPLRAMRTAGFALIALTVSPPCETLAAFCSRARPSRVALLVGTEGSGLTPQVQAAADARVHIPISPRVDSLNLAVATGIALERLAAPTRRV